MKYIFSFIYILIFFTNIFCEIPDIKKLWKKYDNDKVNVIQTQGELQKAYDYVESGQYEKALEIYEKNLNKNINSSHLHTAIGYCFEKMGDYEKAILLYNKAISLTPVDPVSYNNLAFIIAQTANSVEDVIPAIKFTELALKYKKNDMSFLKTRLFVLKQAGLEEKWIDAVEGFLKLFPNIVDINIEYGIYLYQKKDYQNSKFYLNKGLPDKKALEYLNKIPNTENVVVEKENIDKKIVQNQKSTNLDILNANSTDVYDDNLLKEFSEDYKVRLIDKDFNKESLSKKINKNSENNLKIEENINSPASPGIFNLRISYDDDFDKGITNYTEGYFEKSLEYFEKYYDYCMKNKIFNEKLSRSAKYIGLINTKFGKSNDKYWDIIDFIDECVFVEKHITLITSKSYSEARQNLEARYQTKNRDEFSNILNYRILNFDKKNFSTSINELIDIEFIYSSSDLKGISVKSQEFFSEGYKRVIEKKSTAPEKYFNLAINEDPQNFLAYLNAGILNIKIENYSEGFDSIRTAMLRCPYNSDIYKTIRSIYNSVALYFY
ncbi:MAG: tetratricopeptide repeat protein [Candidatus Muirbacterium halophilum]|nr:tetratricopeptide repeat protein [Candidatus Muirbacterium halophilum]MCK9475719.1 tetratricopeptide repeat protein [Candidatus Muirbacterium halophilum]